MKKANNPWNNLPNAKHIDFVLGNIKSHIIPKNIDWDEDIFESEDICDIAVTNICGFGQRVIWDTIWHEAWELIWGMNRALAEIDGFAHIINHTILALVAFDDCSHLLYTEPKEVEVLAKLGMPDAILMLAASIVTSKTKELL